MWDDFTIGEFDAGSSATKVGCYSNLSQNRQCYWWQNDFLGGRVGLDTDEGRHITKMVSDGETDNDVEGYMIAIAVKHTPIDDLNFRINELCKVSFENGRRYQAKQIQKALNY